MLIFEFLVVSFVIIAMFLITANLLFTSIIKIGEALDHEFTESDGFWLTCVVSITSLLILDFAVSCLM